MKTRSKLIISTALVLAAFACKNPVLDKVKAIAASANPALSLAIGGTTVAAGGSYNLGSTALATTKSATFTISNSGKDSLAASVTASGNFGVASQPSGSIAAGASSSFVISFTPTSPEGIKSGTVTVASNDPDNKSFSFTVTGLGSTIMLAKTGQTTSYAAGDDGALQKGVAWPATRFTQVDSDTYLDNLTGLMWLKDPNPNGAANWAAALTYAHNQAVATHDSYGNWRIPNRYELASLVNYSWSSPAASLTSLGFNYGGHSVQPMYWTSSSTAPTSDNIAWLVNFSNGTITNDIKTSSTYYCWLVRTTTSDKVVSLPSTGAANSGNSYEDGASPAGATWPSPRFLLRGDGTITDLLTGLRWQASPSSTTLSWSNALSSATSSSLGGSSSWRLPNINELNSIVKIGGTGVPADWLNGQGFSGVQAGVYWSSTAYAPTTDSRWYIDLSSGAAAGEDRANAHQVILVRSE
jgi:hypothetical protein